MRRFLLAPLGLLFGLNAMAQNSAAPTSLSVTAGPVLVDCAPVTQIPCMGASITPVDASGKPAPVTLPGPADLLHAVTLHSSQGDIAPFYVASGSGPDSAQHSNVVLLVVDISGSMNQPAPGSTSRFAAVQEAVGKYLEGMQEGTDRIAIVPFESHNVVSTVRSAVYVSTKADALSQLHGLPAPSPKNNTALYQAVFSGVDSLKSEISSLQHEGHTSQEMQPHLVIMTDGKNEVLAGDDAQLLNGDLGLQQAAEQVQASHLDVLGIGFGDRQSIDAAAMQRLSKRFIYAADAGELLAALHSSRSAASHQIQLLWLLPASNRMALMGHDYDLTAELRLAGSQPLTGAPLKWLSPATNAPNYERKALAPELQSLIQVHPSADSGWTGVVVHSLLFVVAAMVILMLWYWVPRLIWGDRHIGVVQPTKRWSSERGGVTSAAGVQIRSSSLPAGFDPALDQADTPVQRSASQITQVPVRGEFSRSRLTYDEK